MDGNQIIVTDENGNERALEILFTFDSNDTGKKYVLYYDPEEDQPNVIASSFDEEGHLFEVESPEEWDMIEEVFNSFMAQEEDEEEGHECCHGEGECCGGDEEGCCCGDNEDGCCCGE